MDIKLNKLTERLMAEGWTQEQTPPGCRPWNKWEGGWTYEYGSRLNVVFETPCGLLLERGEVSHSGYMSYMGVDWMEENDNPTIICPYYARTGPCAWNHPLLEGSAIAGCHDEHLHFCAVHETDKPFDYERSVRRVQDLAKTEENRLWQEFSDRHQGRVCRHHCRYNRNTKTWRANYVPEQCAQYGCSYCVVLQKEIDRISKGNVFYDRRETCTVGAAGMFPEQEVVRVTKGIKLLDKSIPLQLCEAIVKYGLGDVKSRLLLNWHWDLFMNPGLKIEFINFRAEKKVGRDLLQDLEDVKNGIAVHHAADIDRETKERKRRRREEARQRKMAAMEKKILSRGMDAFSPYQRERFETFLGVERCEELDLKWREQQTLRQISLF